MLNKSAIYFSLKKDVNVSFSTRLYITQIYMKFHSFFSAAELWNLNCDDQ